MNWRGNTANQRNGVGLSLSRLSGGRARLVHSDARISGMLREAWPPGIYDAGNIAAFNGFEKIRSLKMHYFPVNICSERLNHG